MVRLEESIVPLLFYLFSAFHQSHRDVPYPTRVGICAKWIRIGHRLGGQPGRPAPVTYPTAAGGTRSGERWCWRHYLLLGAAVGVCAAGGDRMPGLEHDRPAAEQL